MSCWRSRRASQNPSRPASKATQTRRTTRPTRRDSSRQRSINLNSCSGSGGSFFSGSRASPGARAATSQLDWLISMTTINVLSGSRAVRDLLRSKGLDMERSIVGLTAAMVHYFRRPPHSISPAHAGEGAIPWATPSRVAVGLEHRELERFLGAAAGPEDELESLIMFLARRERRVDDRAALQIAGLRAAGKAMGVAEHDDVLLAPEIEMAEPQLLVDHLNQCADLGALARRNFQIERTADVKRLHVRQPGERDFVLRPDPGDQDRDFVLVGAVERPLVEGSEALDHIDRMLGPLDGFVHSRGHR